MEVEELIYKLKNRNFPKWFENQIHDLKCHFVFSSYFTDNPPSLNEKEVDFFLRAILKKIFEYYEKHQKDKIYYDLNDKKYNKGKNVDPDKAKKNNYQLKIDYEINLYDIILYCIYRDLYIQYVEYNNIFILKIYAVNLLRICGTKPQLLHKKDFDELEKYLDRFCIEDVHNTIDENFKEYIKFFIRKIRKESVFKVIIHNIVFSLNEMTDHDNQKYLPNILMKCEKVYKINNHLESYYTINKRHDVYISIGDNNPKQIFDMVLEFDEAFHNSTIEKDVNRNSICKLSYSYFSHLTEIIYSDEVIEFLENKFIKNFIDISDSKKKKIIVKYLEEFGNSTSDNIVDSVLSSFNKFIKKFTYYKNILLRNKIKYYKSILKYLDDIKNPLKDNHEYHKIDELISEINNNVFSEKEIKTFLKYFFQFTNNEESNSKYSDNCRNFQIHQYVNFFIDVVEQIFLATCYYKQDRAMIAQYIIAQTDNFKALSDDDKQEQLLTIQKLLHLYLKKEKDGYVCIDEIASILGIRKHLLLENIKYSIKLKPVLINEKDSEEQYFATGTWVENDLEEIILAINNISLSNFQFPHRCLWQNISEILENNESNLLNENQIVLIKDFFDKINSNKIESTRIEIVKSLIKQCIKCLAISSKLLLENYHKHTISTLHHLPVFIQHLKGNIFQIRENKINNCKN